MIGIIFQHIVLPYQTPKWYDDINFIILYIHVQKV